MSKSMRSFDSCLLLIGKYINISKLAAK